MVVHLLAGNRQEIEKAREKLFSDFLYSIFSIFLCNNKGVTKQYINSIKIAKLYSPGKVILDTSVGKIMGIFGC